MDSKGSKYVTLKLGSKHNKWSKLIKRLAVFAGFAAPTWVAARTQGNATSLPCKLPQHFFFQTLFFKCASNMSVKLLPNFAHAIQCSLVQNFYKTNK